MGIVV